jgi:hypothetical protein
MLSRILPSWALLCAVLACGCAEPTTPGVTSKFDPDAGFFDAPFPIAHRSRPDGSLRVADFPYAATSVAQLLALLEEGNGGFALNGAVFVPFEGPVDGSRLPADPAASLEPEATVFLIDVDPESPRRGERIPLETSFYKDARSHAPANVLVALPYAGFVLAPHTLYALIVERGLGDVEGRPLYAPAELVDALDGFLPAGPLRDAFEPLRDWISETGFDMTQIAAATVFETGDPTAEIIGAHGEVSPPTVDSVRLIESRAGYCVMGITTSLPDETVITLPHATMPESGFPLVVYSGASEGSREDPPADVYAARGLATMKARPSNAWNLDDLGAFRDDVRQNILDIASVVALAKSLTIDATLCPDASSTTASFTFDRLFIHGHSDGSIPAGAAIALEPELDAAVLSGASGSWIHRLVTAAPPQLAADDRFDPVLTLFQTAFEAVEPMSWAPRIIREPLTTAKQVLLVQGVPDSRQSPRAINAYAMSMGLDLVLPEIEPSARADYELAGRNVFPAPITGNITGIGAQLITGVTIQHGAASDGHQVIFELDEAKYRYGCFMASMVEGGTGTVPTPSSDPLAPCP